MYVFRIIVGAPLGRYPGGLDLPQNPAEQCGTGINDTSYNTTGGPVEYLRTGLVYRCPLVGPNTACQAMLGDGVANQADGQLFDRCGKLVNHTVRPILLDWLSCVS